MSFDTRVVGVSCIKFIKAADAKGRESALEVTSHWETHHVLGILCSGRHGMLDNLDRFPSKVWT